MYGYGVYLEIFFIAAELLDCMNECLNVDTGNCQLFAFQNGNCYLGRADVTNGAIAERLANVIVYSVTCKFQQQGLTMLWKCVYCNRSMINLRFFILSALLAYKNKSYLYNFGEKILLIFPFVKFLFLFYWFQIVFELLNTIVSIYFRSEYFHIVHTTRNS